MLTGFIKYIFTISFLLLALPAMANREKVIRIISGGEALQEYRAADIDYVEVQEMIPAPENVAATLAGESILLNWEAVEGGIYKVYRSADNMIFREIAKDLTEAEFIDIEPLDGVNYYKVKAVVEDMESSSSVSVSMTYAGAADDSQGSVKGLFLGVNGTCNFGENELRLATCVLKYNIFDQNETNPYKILQTGTSGGKVFFNHLNLTDGTIYEFSADEVDYSGIKSYRFERNGHEAEITIDWDKYNYLFPAGCYAPLSEDNGLSDGYLIVVSQYGKINVVNMVGDALEGVLGDFITEAVEHTVEEVMDAAVGLSVEEAVEATVGPAVGQALEEALGPAVGQAVDEALGTAIDEVKDKIKGLQNNIGVMLGGEGDKHIDPFPRTTPTDYFRNLYVLNNTPFEKEGWLKKIRIGYSSPTRSESEELVLYIGKIDHRGTLLNPRSYTYPLAELDTIVGDSGTDLTINLEDKAIRVNEGDVMCFYSKEYNEEQKNNFLIERTDTESDRVLTASEITGTFTPSYDFALLEYDISYFDTGFASKEKVKSVIDDLSENVTTLSKKIEMVSEDVATLSSLLNSANILTDEVTGETYTLSVSNGRLLLRNTKRHDYKNALFIGSSFVTHPVSESIGWYYEGPMAPSVAQNSLPSLVLRGLRERNQDCTLSVASSINWERNYNDSAYDFAIDLAPTIETINPDVVFMHISGNCTWTEEFKGACSKLIKEVKGLCPLSDIIIAASWHGGQKADDFKAACLENNVTYADLSSYKVADNMWGAGDYYLDGDTERYFPIYEAVRWHPNDMGCLLQANAYLRAAGYTPLEICHRINLTTTGEGSASVPNIKWVEDGVVTIRINSGTVDTVTVTTVSGEKIAPTERTNDQNPEYTTYYTFIMPHEEVDVEVTFK